MLSFRQIIEEHTQKSLVKQKGLFTRLKENIIKKESFQSTPHVLKIINVESANYLMKNHKL
jgi:hypothetical protein